MLQVGENSMSSYISSSQQLVSFQQQNDKSKISLIFLIEFCFLIVLFHFYSNFLSHFMIPNITGESSRSSIEIQNRLVKHLLVMQNSSDVKT